MYIIYLYYVPAAVKSDYLKPVSIYLFFFLFLVFTDIFSDGPRDIPPYRAYRLSPREQNVAFKHRVIYRLPLNTHAS